MFGTYPRISNEATTTVRAIGRGKRTVEDTAGDINYVLCSTDEAAVSAVTIIAAADITIDGNTAAAVRYINIVTIYNLANKAGSKLFAAGDSASNMQIPELSYSSYFLKMAHALSLLPTMSVLNPIFLARIREITVVVMRTRGM